MTGSDDNLDNPRRDVNAPTSTCDHCGGGAHSTLGGEHIWKCSECVPVGELVKLAERLETRDWVTEEANLQARRDAEALRELINKYQANHE
jgi:hypothetical protein